MSRYALRQRSQQSAYMDRSMYTDTDQTVLTEPINIDVIATQAKAGIGTTETRRLTHEYIMNRPSPESRLDAVIVALDFASTGTEALGAIAMEAWSVLNSKTVWQGRFQSAKEARDRLDTAQLSVIRKLFGAGEQRKDRAIKNIRREWPNIAEGYDILPLGEHHLEEIARIAEKYTYSDARTLLVGIRNRRLRQDRGGRSASRQITTGDWRKLRLLPNCEENQLRQESVLSAQECQKYNIKNDEQLQIIHTLHLVSRDTKNQRRRYHKSLRRKQHAEGVDGDSTALNDGRSSSTQTETEPEIADIDGGIQINRDFTRNQDDDDTRGESEDDSDQEGDEGSESAQADIEMDPDFIDGIPSEPRWAEER
jgi:hypothetical protein